MARGWLVAVGVATLTISVQADLLVLRNGRQIRGELVGYRDGTIEFREERSSGSYRTVEYDRDDIERIEFDEGGFGSTTGGRPGGLREREIYVDARTGWNDTSVDVRSGQDVYFEAEGQVTWGPGRRHGPAGENNSPRNPGRPIPGRPAAALIGRIGEGTDIFFIGDETGAIRMRATGRLFLGINDDFLDDNRGSFRVTVYY